jgi:heptosyltransferase-2
VLKSKKKVGYNKQRSLRKAIVKGDHQKAIDSTVQLYMSSLQKLGIDNSYKYPRLKVEAKVFDTGSIAIFPGATHFTKRYPIESWIQLIKLNPQTQFSLFGSAYDIEACNAIASACASQCTSFAGMFGYEDLLNSLQTCKLVISGDTGPMHLAAALNLPQIAIFGGTHPRLGFRPLNDKAKVVYVDLPCQPCSLHGDKTCPLGHFKCMKMLTPELLSSAIYEVLST